MTGIEEGLALGTIAEAGIAPSAAGMLAGATAAAAPAAGLAAAAAPTIFTAGNILAAASTLVGAAGLFSQSQQQRAAGEAQQNALNYQATLRDAQAQALEQRAGQERAAAQRVAMDQRRQGNLVSSRVRALAAAGGGDTLDPTLTDIEAGIANETDYRALTALYQGDAAGQALDYNATLTRGGAASDIYAGQVARNAADFSANQSLAGAGGRLLEGGASIYDRIQRRNISNTILSQGNGFGRYAYA